MTTTKQPPLTRFQQWQNLFPDQPAYRWRQIEQALFELPITGWSMVTTLPKLMRDTAEKNIPWMSIQESTIAISEIDQTRKAALQAADGLCFETVLMPNRRGQWTICVSSQVGCAMRCSFCATGTMGWRRNLTTDEIIDQCRYWQAHLQKNNLKEKRISNVVFMGMGEPLANYDAVKSAITTLLSYTDIGSTKITVSTVGLLPQLRILLNDPTWPHVRLAISLHSARPEIRPKIVPTSPPDFLKNLLTWSGDYLKKYGNRRHYLTFEYVLLHGINDQPIDAKALITFMKKVPNAKVNVIPYNPVADKPYSRSQESAIKVFKKMVMDAEIDITQRKNLGMDIAAACGQLVKEHAIETENEQS